jgi:hypothetical protein
MIYVARHRSERVAAGKRTDPASLPRRGCRGEHTPAVFVPVSSDRMLGWGPLDASKRHCEEHRRFLFRAKIANAFSRMPSLTTTDCYTRQSRC